jgi:hypothetical protein
MEENKTSCPVRVYSKSELAGMYNPGLAPGSALRTLLRWINRNKQLAKALKEIGYQKTRHFFLSREVDLIFEYLGTP